MTTIPTVFDYALHNRPVGQILILTFFLGFNNVTRKMTSNMFHTFIPGTFAFKDSATEAASAALWWLALLHPASIANFFQTVLKGPPVLIPGITGCNGA
jgi:hypothetical protein